MDVQGFTIAKGTNRLRDVVVLSGDRAGQIVPAGLVREDEFTMMNAPVKEGDLIIPLRLFESAVLIQPVEYLENAFPIIKDRGKIQRWIRLESDPTGNEGFDQWRMKLREFLLMEALEDISGARLWGPAFRKIMEISGLEQTPVRTRIDCTFSLRWGSQSRSLSDVMPGIVEELASGGFSSVNVQTKLKAVVYLMNSETGCQCNTWRGRGLRDDSRPADPYRSGGEALFGALRARVPEGAEIIDLTVTRMRCAYCES